MGLLYLQAAFNGTDSGTLLNCLPALGIREHLKQFLEGSPGEDDSFVQQHTLWRSLRFYPALHDI